MFALVLIFAFRSRHTHGHPPHIPILQVLRHNRWAEARIKITRMTLTIKLDRNWSSFQLANSAPPLSVIDSAIAPSARMQSSKASSATDSATTNALVVYTGPQRQVHSQVQLRLRPRESFETPRASAKLGRALSLESHSFLFK